MIAVYERMDVEECKTMCIDEYRCRSINHSKDQNRCEINDKIKETSDSSNFKAKAGYAYLATSYSTKNVGILSYRKIARSYAGTNGGDDYGDAGI